MDKGLIQKLHEKKIIDKRAVLWWQFGFEGRQILTDEEFQDGLVNVSWMPALVKDCPGDNSDFRKEDYEESPKNISVWIKDDVPILLKDITIEDVVVPCFITAKPMSHDRRGGWRDLTFDIGGKWPMSWFNKFYQPHIRGVVIEKTDRHLFWYPLLLGVTPMHYATRGMQIGDYFAIVDSIYPSRFYKNLVTSQWSFGRRAQKSPLKFDCLENDYRVVPYFEFDKTQKQVIVYPAPILSSRFPKDQAYRLLPYIPVGQLKDVLAGDLTKVPIPNHGPLTHLVRWKRDFPIIVKSDPGSEPEILGMGYTDINYFGKNPGEDVHFWQIPDKFKGQVKDYLKSKGIL